jgi:uroporphyrinogen decarboxylase
VTSNRDWVQSTLDRCSSEAVPYNFMFSPPAQRLVEAHYGDDLEEALSLPIRMTGLKSIKPLYADPDEFGETARDEFGVTWSTSRIDRGSPIGPCLPDPDLSGYQFPNPMQAYRFSDVGAWCARQEGHYRIIWVGDLWERATFMRGMEALLEDVALRPAFVEALLDRLTDYVLQGAEALFEGQAFEGIAVSDDYGTQKSMLISPRDWRRFVKPCLSRIYDTAKRHSRTVFHHSCGHITPIVGDLIDMGLDILHPIQPESMDIQFLKREFGRHLTFCGGIPTQTLLVSGTAAQVRDEVRRLKQEMGEGGGYILEPGITLQADVPKENLLAMIEEAGAPV